MRPRVLHLAHREIGFPFSEAFISQLKELGSLRIVAHAEQFSKREILTLMRESEILLTAWGSEPIPVELAQDAGRLRYICNITGTVRGWIPLEVVRSGIPVTNWGHAPAGLIAEGAVTLLLAVMKDLRSVIAEVARGSGHVDEQQFPGGTLRDLRVGVYGAGVIGRQFIEMLRPFGSVVRLFDPFIQDIPDGCIVVPSLQELFAHSDTVVIHAGLTDETRCSVTGDLLSLLPSGGILINTARGDIVDQPALFAELERGRLRAGLDVLAGPDSLPGDHPARGWPNLIYTTHQIERTRWPHGESALVREASRICVENVQNFLEGRPLAFQMDETRFLLST